MLGVVAAVVLFQLFIQLTHRLPFWVDVLLAVPGGLLFAAGSLWLRRADGSADPSAQVVQLHLGCGIEMARQRARAALWALSGRPVRVAGPDVLVLRTAVTRHSISDVVRIELHAGEAGVDVTVQSGPWIRTPYYDPGRGEFNLEVLTRSLQPAPAQ